MRVARPLHWRMSDDRAPIDAAQTCRCKLKKQEGVRAQALLQFEDFNLEHAQPLLERYRYHHLVFNDDIQARWALLHPPHGPACILKTVLAK